jgi:hypothetical protein
VIPAMVLQRAQAQRKHSLRSWDAFRTFTVIVKPADDFFRFVNGDLTSMKLEFPVTGILGGALMNC